MKSLFTLIACFSLLFSSYTNEISASTIDSSSVTVLDFESDSTSVVLGYFANSPITDSTSVIANPDATGANTSANVMQFVRGGAADPWAGAVFKPEGGIDATKVYQICVDYWSPLDGGNLSLKLEMADGGDPKNWIIKVANPTPNQWNTLCFDLSMNSIEGDMTPATGKMFEKLVIFPEFGTSGDGNDMNIYLDNFVMHSDNSVKDQDVTFHVDMNSYEGDFTKVFVSGTFNEWSGESNELTDEDGDGVYSSTVTLPQGNIEYKFTVDNWASQEEFTGAEDCTSPMSSEFKNRLYAVTSDAELDPVCWGSCYACGQEVSVTFEVNMSTQAVSESGVFLAGGAEFGHGLYPMSDDDGDQIYTITVPRYLGYSSHYTFINGICESDWACKEDISGQDCADANNYNDRFLDSLTTDITISTCFGECSTDGTCSGGSNAVMVTFQVDVPDIADGDSVFIAGNTINNWTPGATPLMDVYGIGEYSLTMELTPGNHEYKFIKRSGGADQWEELEQGLDCTITDQSGQYTNRLLTLGDQDTVLSMVQFGSCDVVTDISRLEWDDELATALPTLFDQFITVTVSNKIGDYSLRLVDLTGKVVTEQTLRGSEQKRINTSTLSKGMYFLTVSTKDKVYTTKMVKQ